MTNQISRRTLARGAAWSVPVATVSVAAPAYAVSRPCSPVLTSGGGFSYDWGVANTERTNQTLKAAGSLTVRNLPADAVITTVDYRLIVMNRVDGSGTNWQDYGAYDPGNSKVNKPTYYPRTQCSVSYSTITGCDFTSLYNTTVAPGSAALADGNRQRLLYRSRSETDPIWVADAARIFLESNWVDRTFRDGKKGRAWTLKFQSDPSKLTASHWTTDSTTGCKTLTIKDTPIFELGYSGVRGPTAKMSTWPTADWEVVVEYTTKDGRKWRMTRVCPCDPRTGGTCTSSTVQIR
ncbi:hypothetical protein M3A96_02290 [Helcobacillus massiliensis]|uniref:hypothetical protein n=1 Tax=Helcobacillus massiliensis TaxID=521392 RepID=UPI0021A58F46|nr:hypothetical protein [Helcobacillus massiliensis]MCT1556957.1 hypothetical protein [Helcobacillus massiliensis]MCT2035346.1 hypothetical protein [Helcobacillus massiliensis]MCT2331439.1 hypothetical protein [Helcobacillus massiliensis]